MTKGNVKKDNIIKRVFNLQEDWNFKWTVRFDSKPLQARGEHPQLIINSFN